VAPSWRLRRDEVEDRRVDIMGCVRSYYPYFIIFYVLNRRGIVFSLLVGPINSTLEGWGYLTLHQTFISIS
jgi:hypothetical protein